MDGTSSTTDSRSKVDPNMILTIDIGNSFTKWGLWEESILDERFKSLTSLIENKTSLDALLADLSTKGLTSIYACSVVPQATDILSKRVKEVLALDVQWITGESELGIDVEYQTRHSLGSDRLVAAFGAFKRYGGPAIVCDFGTATTIDLVREDGTFAGGLIAPGFNMMSESLGSKAAQLFTIETTKPDSILGVSTDSALKSGVFHSVIGLLETSVRRMSSEMTTRPKVVATGGNVQLVASGTDVIDVVDEDLVLRGLLEAASL
jgi:type III pantothenate kinase